MMTCMPCPEDSRANAPSPVAMHQSESREVGEGSRPANVPWQVGPWAVGMARQSNEGALRHVSNLPCTLEMAGASSHCRFRVDK